MSAIVSFNPIADQSARTLILGSMPGVLSLKASQYYAHPRNAFWHIMASIYGFDAGMPYAHRVEALKASQVALWDVLHSCIRQGSLDSAIETGSRVPNDFQSFFSDHPNIKLVGFNGNEAEKSFRLFVLPKLSVTNIEFVRLPSTSPAHTMHMEKKIEAWRAALMIQNTSYKLIY
ncbi:MAG TPA: DNA-deoxyinosine glycosylase [Methylophilaceae bacterium]|nr:DNA-deoxyinosine glycosylase [Methylophilaceae bacterium]